MTLPFGSTGSTGASSLPPAMSGLSDPDRPGSGASWSSAPTATSSGSSTNENFKVVIRVRPPLDRETAGGKRYQHSAHVGGDATVCTLSENLEAWRAGHGPVDADGLVFNTHQFAFDHVHDQHASQREVYENSARDAVLSTLQGYNAAILAYGQTGTGKTYTMEGDPHARRARVRGHAGAPPPKPPPGDFDETGAERGIIPRAIEDVFDSIARDSGAKSKYLVRASYVQIYNEVISDLLKPERANLNIREDKKRGVYVDGLSEWVVKTPDEIYGLMDRGATQRTTGSTKMNELSSRSHAVFIIIVENARIEEEPGGQTKQSFKVGKLNLVDLAGSERVHLTGAVGVRLEESKKINQSLSSLGNVIKALTEPKGSRSHIPYRDSKLTRILEDSLGGNCKTTMMAMISPALEAFAESLSTLKFANRAKFIKNTARVNEDLDQKSLLRKYERELKRLRQELDERTKNLVDKRALLQLDEQRRKAEADKMRAITELEQRSREFLKEKKEKSELEDKINAMQSQMLGGRGAMSGGALGGPSDSFPVDFSSGAFAAKLEEEQSRIRDEYEGKLRELEQDRAEAEEGRAQVGRYKAVLLKQRDIMIALTARLNERDETIIRMQEELKAYDAEYRRVEDALDAKTAELIALRRAAMRHSAGSPNGAPWNQELVDALGGWAGANERSGRQTEGGAATPEDDDDRGGGGGGGGGAGSAAAASELRALRAEVKAKTAEAERLRAETIRLAKRAGGGGARGGSDEPRSGASASLGYESDSVAARYASLELQYESFRREMTHRLEEKNERMHDLEEECARLRLTARSSGGAGGRAVAEAEAREAALEEKVDGFRRERAALVTIMRKKVATLVEGIGRGVAALEGKEVEAKAPRLAREVKALERLVAATVSAMDRRVRGAGPARVRSSDDRSFRFAVARFGHLAARTIVLSFDFRAALRHAALGFALLALVHSRVLLLAACACALVARDFGRFSYLRWRARRTLRALLCAAGLGRADSDAMPGSGFSDADATEPEIEDVEAVGLLPPDAHVHDYDDVIRAFSSASADLDRLADLPAGLTNSGNTCFAASALQCLYHTRLLTAHFAADPHDAESCATGASSTGGFCVTCEYQRHVRRSLDAAPAASFGIGRLTSSIGRIAKHFVRGRQEDSHEYISGLLDRMHVEELKSKFGADAEKILDARTQETSFVYHVFGGYTVGRVVCGSCGHESRNYQSALDIPIEVSSGGGARGGFMSGRGGTSSASGGGGVIRSLERNFVETEELAGANKYKCASCRAYVVAEKGAKIHVSPNVLVLPLKRYQMGRASKITKHVEFPERLDLTPYMSEDAPREGETKPEYRLYGVVVHLDFMGSAHSGHYVAFVRLRGGGGGGGGRGEEDSSDEEGGGDRWVKCDDGRVTETDLETVLAQKAYLLFYERRGFRAGFPTRTDAERKRADALREANKARTARILARREEERRGKIAAAAAAGNAAKGSSPGRSRATRSPGRRLPSTAEAPASVASSDAEELGSDGGSDDSDERPSAPMVKPRFSLVGKQPHSDADDSASADSDDDSSRLRDPWPVRVACEMSLPTVSSASQVRVEVSEREVSVAARRQHRAVVGAVSADVALPYPVDDDGCEVSFDATTRTLRVVAPAQKRDARAGAAHAAFLERRRERRDASGCPAASGPASSGPASRRSSAVARLRRAGMRKDSSGASSRGKKSESERASRGSRDGADGDSSDSDDGGADDLARAMGLGLRVVDAPSDREYLSDDEVEPEVEITDASATRGRVEVTVKVPGVTRAAAVEAEHAPDEADERRSVLSVRVRGRYRATIELPARVAEDAVLEAKLKRREGKIAFVLPVEAPKPPGVRAR